VRTLRVDPLDQSRQHGTRAQFDEGVGRRRATMVSTELVQFTGRSDVVVQFRPDVVDRADRRG
jgi:hypothetical protein